MKRRRILLVSSAVVLATALACFFVDWSGSPAVRSTSSTDKAVESRPSPPPAKTAAVPTREPPAVPRPPAQTKAEVLAEVALTAGDSNTGRRLALVERLAALGPGAERLLGGALLEARTDVERAILADALARIGTSEAVDRLFEAVQAATDPAVREQLLQALNALPPGQPLETLASTLTMALDPQIRDGVVATIARAADPDTVEFLNEMYHEPESFGGQGAGILAALGSIHNPGATTALSTLLRTSGEVPVMQNAAASLGKIGTADSLQPIADTLQVIGETNPELRQHLLGVIQVVNNTAARDWLQKNAISSDTGLAQAAAAALSSMPPPSS
ncbi:MAG: HEAT repeat domain-containing protein [Prosthecobacter sp.]